MIIDKKQSMKNKIGIVVISLAVSNTALPSVVIAQNSDSRIEINYVYDQSIIGKDIDELKNYNLVSISDNENGNCVVVSLDQLDEILENQEGPTITINDLDFPRYEVEVKKNEKVRLTKIVKERKKFYIAQNAIVGGLTLLGGIVYGAHTLTNKLKSKREQEHEKAKNEKIKKLVYSKKVETEE